MNPRDLYRHKAVQYRPTYKIDPDGGTRNIVNLGRPFIQPADAAHQKPADDPVTGEFPCFWQIFGHVQIDQGGGEMLLKRFDLFCDFRDVRQNDLFLVKVNFNVPFFLHVDNYSDLPDTHGISTFMRIFTTGVAPPEGYQA